jgi:hypothetical protein
MFFKTRSGFTTADFEFIAWTLGTTPSDREEIAASCADPASAAVYLRDARLFERSMTPPPVFLDISPGLFFYIFVFRALDRRSLADDDVVDYVSGVCSEFRSAGPLLQVASHEGAFFYITDLLNLMEELDGPRRHLLRRYIGDATLFLTGFFPRFFSRRSVRRGAPPIGFYQEVARSQYSDASLDPDARAEETAGVLSSLAERFADVSSALNELSEEYGLVGRRGGPGAGPQRPQLVV